MTRRQSHRRRDRAVMPPSAASGTGRADFRRLVEPPSFTIASSRDWSRRMREVRERVAVDQQQVGERALLHQAQLARPAS